MIQPSLSPVVHLELEVCGSRAKMRRLYQRQRESGVAAPNARACIRRQPNLLLRRSRDHDSLRRSESDRGSR
jgi:hypothetical protein